MFFGLCWFPAALSPRVTLISSIPFAASNRRNQFQFCFLLKVTHMLSRIAQLRSKVEEKVRVAMARTDASASFITIINEDPWGPTGPQMDELLSMYAENDYEIQLLMQQQLEARQDSWRKCYKTLLLLDHFMRNLDSRFVDDLRGFVPTLREISTSFRVTLEGQDANGVSVRERAKKILELFSNDSLLQEERVKALQARKRTGATSYISSSSSSYSGYGGDGAGDSNRYAGTSGEGRFRGAGQSSAEIGVAASPVTTSYPANTNFSTGGTTSVQAEKVRRQRQEDEDMRLAMQLQAEEDARARADARRREEADHRLAMQVQQGTVQPSGTPTQVGSTRTFPAPATATRAPAAPVAQADPFAEFVSARVSAPAAPVAPVGHKQPPHQPAPTTTVAPAAPSLLDIDRPKEKPKATNIDDLFGGLDNTPQRGGGPVGGFSTAPAPTAATTTAQNNDPFADFVASRTTTTATAPSGGYAGYSSAPPPAQSGAGAFGAGAAGRAW